ncbi:MAG: RimK family alpha-L-glutamate ligase [Oscillospiraceae bacterium]|nr:RimK family alpha-L-glutamate ligase [Oscillospiraceae bacterium]
MRGLLIVNSFLKTEKFSDIYARLASSFENLGVELSLCGNADFPHSVGSSLPISEKPDFVLFWDKDILLAREFEEASIPVFNSSRAIELCDDKRKMHLALTGLPMPETFIAPMTFPNIGFTNLSFFDAIEEKLGYPMVIKEAFGSFGAQVYLAKSRDEALEIIKRCERVPLIFQKFIKESAGRDIRINVVGHKVVSAMERRSSSDFRSNVTLGGETLPYTPTETEIALAEEASRCLGLDFGGIDILFGDCGPLLCEVNSNAHFKSTYDCTGINLADLIAEHIAKKVAK